MSRRPGIGAAWFEQFSAELEHNDSVVARGREMKPPRYYDKLRAKAAALFVLMLSATVLSLLGEAEWQLGLGIVWELLGIPLQAVILMLALRGLALGVRAERHAELRVVALYTSVFFLCAASPSQWPIFVAGDYWPYANLPFVLPYPIVCYFMIRRGLAKLAAGSAPTS
jgi:hypothetical protein